MSMQIHEWDLTKSIATKLTILGFDWAILGGYPRDLALNNVPKDLDIFVTTRPSETKLEELYSLLDEMSVPYEVFENTEWTEDNAPVSCAGAEQLRKVIKVGTCIDIIFWKERFNTVRSIVDNFDFNINQFQLVLGNPVFLGESMGTLKKIRDTATAERCSRVKYLAERAGWNIECLVEKTPQFPMLT